MFKRFSNIILTVLFALWSLVVQPVWNINVERWAEARSFDEGINQVSQDGGGFVVPIWLTDLLAYFFGGFFQGMAALAAIYLFYDAYVWLFKAKSKKERFVEARYSISSVLGALVASINRSQRLSGMLEDSDIINPEIVGKYYGLHDELNNLGISMPAPHFISLPDKTGKKATQLSAFLQLLIGMSQAGLIKDAKRECAGFTEHLEAQFLDVDTSQASEQVSRAKLTSR